MVTYYLQAMCRFKDIIVRTGNPTHHAHTQPLTIQPLVIQSDALD